MATMYIHHMQDTISKTKMTEGTTRHREGHRAITGSTKKKNREQRTASVGGKAKSCAILQTQTEDLSPSALQSEVH